jgi:peptidoglycan/LPS O-acetylase OafA/YrhL
VTSEHRIRKEIQFLRAVAVTLVVLSHLDIGKFSGGFVGVDMFFVVSGFVIGLTMVNEQTSTGKVSLKRFFERRFFRIYPPLAFMVIGASAYAYVVLAFDRSQDFFIQQARAALFSYGNFFFMFHKMDYFLQDANSTFFLHTWSLGLEEQFYFLLPIFIVLLAVLGRRKIFGERVTVWKRGFAALGVASLASALAIYNGYLGWFSSEFRSVFVFYSTLTRAWEFLLGLFVAVVISQRELRGDIQLYKRFSLAATISITSLVFVLIAYVTFGWSQFVVSSITAFATAILIYSLPRSALNRQSIFGNRVFQAVGNSSYSIYLWHWIAVAIAEDIFQPANAKRKSALVLLSVVPAILSYRFVEIPFRNARKLQKKRKVLLAISLVIVPVTVLWGLEISTLRAREDYGNVFPSTVLDDCDYWSQVCEIGSDNESNNILLLGDSHAYSIIPIFQALAVDSDVRITTCVKVCFEKNIVKISDKTFLEEYQFDLIVTMFKTNTGIASREYRSELAGKIADFVIRSKSEYLIVLDNPFNVDHKSPRRIRLPELIPLSRADQDEVANPITQDWKDDAGEGTYFYDPFTVLCNATECPLEQDGKVLYLDNNHLSMPGVRLLEPSLIALVTQILDK